MSGKLSKVFEEMAQANKVQEKTPGEFKPVHLELPQAKPS